MSLCCICNDSTLEIHSCGALFHQECLKKWATHMPGEIISLNKIQCPNCKEFLDLTSFSVVENGKIFTKDEIEALDSKSYHKRCKTCFEVFACGGKECEASIAQMPDRCSSCESKIFRCPKCGIELEHAGGCNAFACCLKGWHGCSGASCDHGSTEFTKFCGHRWCIEDSQAVARRERERFQNPLGDNPTYEYCLREVQRYGWLLTYVPEDLKTSELCLAAVTGDGSALQHVPEALKTSEICHIAATRNKRALQYVPVALMTIELCLAALTRDGLALRYVPETLKTPELCLFAVTRYGGALQYVPSALKTPELCLTAVTRDVYALRYVPEALKTSELCLAAVTQDGTLLDYIPYSLITPELCLAAVTQNCQALQYVPDGLKTPELCLEAMSEDSSVIRYIPNFSKIVEEMSLDMGYRVINRDWRMIRHISNSEYYQELCLAAVEKCCHAIENIHKNRRTFEICLTAVKANWRCLNSVPAGLKTVEICRIAVKQSRAALQYIPADIQLLL